MFSGGPRLSTSTHGFTVRQKKFKLKRSAGLEINRTGCATKQTARRDRVKYIFAFNVASQNDSSLVRRERQRRKLITILSREFYHEASMNNTYAYT